MSITSIGRYFVGNPNIVSIVTDDDLATITSSGYLEDEQDNIEELNKGEFQWLDTDIALISYAPDFKIGWFKYDAANDAFIGNSVPGGNVNSITGTANQVLANGTSGSAQTGPVTLTLPQSIGTSSTPQFAGISFSTNAGIIGTTTNNNAASGSVGQYVTANNALGIFLSSDTPEVVSSTNLDPGDWDVYGAATFTFTGATGSRIQAGLNTTAFMPAVNKYASIETTMDSVHGPNAITVPYQRISLAAQATIYLVVNAVFGNQCLATGIIDARRAR